MYWTSPSVTEALAASRRHDFEQRAANYRLALAGPAMRPRRPIPAIRRTLGRTAVSIGVRLLAEEAGGLPQGC